jgi:hypothetical protein
VSWRDLGWHLFGRIVLFGFLTLGAVVTSYIAQENDPNRPCQYVGIPCENASTR